MLVGQFLLITGGPEAVLEVVVLGGGVVGDAAVAAVVVGEHQSVGGDDLAGAEVLAVLAEFDDGVFDGGVVDVPHLFGCEVQPEVFHRGVVVVFDEHGQPHALVGRVGRAGGHEQEREERQKQSLFHCNLFK